MQFREFAPEDVAAGVVFHLDAQRNTQPNIDQATGQIDLKGFNYGKCTSMADVRERKGKLVTEFQLQVIAKPGDPDVFVTARQDGERYDRPANTTPFGDTTMYTFPPCRVRARDRKDAEMDNLGLGRLAVWCQTNQKNEPANRADIWTVGKKTSDRVADLRLFVITIDDGMSFQLVGEYGWEGAVYKRAHPKPYALKSDKPEVALVFANDKVRDFLRDYVMVPDEGYGNFELKFQALLIPGFIDRLKAAASRVWEGPEDFWLTPTPKIGLQDGQGMVEFHLYGMGEASFGIVNLPKAVMIDGELRDKAQIRHNFVDSEEDDQGLKVIKPGDIVEYDNVVSMDNGGKQYPPMLIGARVLYQYRDAA